MGMDTELIELLLRCTDCGLTCADSRSGPQGLRLLQAGVENISCFKLAKIVTLINLTCWIWTEDEHNTRVQADLIQLTEIFGHEFLFAVRRTFCVTPRPSSAAQAAHCWLSQQYSVCLTTDLDIDIPLPWDGNRVSE